MTRRLRSLDPATFIAENTRLEPVPRIPEIAVYTAHEATGLWRVAEASGEADPPPPYWAFPWAGGLALARHLLDRPDCVAGRRVLDLGTGSGLVAIAAMKAGAAAVVAADIDRFAAAAARINAAANGVHVTVRQEDLTGGPPLGVDVVLVGDLFYGAALAARVTAFLDRCLAAGEEVLIGDPYRAYLPSARLTLLSDYPVVDVGEVEGKGRGRGGVFRLEKVPAPAMTP
ncbi:MAG: 50S ribosomal protein L11 methyltransferase [Bauldia sp.]